MPAPSTTLRRWARAEVPPWLHGEVARRMAERLPIIRQRPRSIVEWWAWSGASDAVLAAAYPKARRVRVEPDAALRARSAQSLRLGWRRRADVRLEGEVAPASGDLLWSNMMLHAAADPRQVIAQWHEALAVDGFLMFSCLGPDTLKTLRALYARLGWGQAAQEFVDMHDLGDILVQVGFADPVMDQEMLSLTFADAPALLRELHALGANAAAARFAGLRTPRWRARLGREMEAALAVGGRLALGFEVVYGHAFKGAPRIVDRADTVVSLESMRRMLRRPPR